MKSLINYINESISGEDLKDLEVCVKLAITHQYFEYSLNDLKEAVKQPDDSKIYDGVIKHFKDDNFDFDLTDSEVLGSISEFVKKYSEEEIKDNEILIKYSK